MARERWDKRLSFIMAAIGSAIGLGNVWRFPFMAYANGGGAFFIPYLIALITTGVPIISLEYYLGIRFQTGPTEVFAKIKKNSAFIGWLGVFGGAMITIYYAIIIAWAWNYVYYSIGVQWSGNENSFFFENVLGLSNRIGNLGSIQWPIFLGVVLTWVSIYFIIFKGTKVVGKVVAWTVSIPWILLLILIIRGITLNGALKGLNYYLTPDFSLLLNPSVWLGAYGQIFFSLSLGFGIMIAYASYLPRDSDIHTNAWIVSFSNCCTSYFAGFAVFSILGYLACCTEQPIESVVAGGPSLAFVVYPAAIATLPGGILVQSIFGVMFFIMLLTLGIDSAFSIVEAIVTGLRDSFDFKREMVTFWICVIGCCVGIFYTTSAGLHWLDVVDHWMNWGLIIVGFLEATLIGWFYNINEASEDIDSTSRIKLGTYWIICVKYITPSILFLTIMTNIYYEFKSPYGGYPIWSLMAGGWILLITLLFFSFIMQGRKSIPSMTLKLPRFLAWLLIYAGLIIGFYMFYTPASPLLSFVILVGSVGMGSMIILMLNNSSVTVPQE